MNLHLAGRVHKKAQRSKEKCVVLNHKKLDILIGRLRHYTRSQSVVILFKAKQMFHYNFEFYLSDNGVWLTDEVPTKYLIIDEETN